MSFKDVFLLSIRSCGLLSAFSCRRYVCAAWVTCSCRVSHVLSLPPSLSHSTFIAICLATLLFRVIRRHFSLIYPQATPSPSLSTDPASLIDDTDSTKRDGGDDDGGIQKRWGDFFCRFTFIAKALPTLKKITHGSVVLIIMTIIIYQIFWLNLWYSLSEILLHGTWD